MDQAITRAAVGAPRCWSLLLTSENHGQIGKLGCNFSWAPGQHERVQVVEVPAAAGAPSDQVNLRLVGLSSLRRTDWTPGGMAARVDGVHVRLADVEALLGATPVAAQAGQVAPAAAPALAEAIGNLCCNEFHAGSPNEEVRRAYGRGYCQARADATELAAGAAAGQVAVPEWRGIKAVLTNLIAVAGVRIVDKDEEDDQLIADASEAVRQLDARLAAAPAAPAQAAPLPAMPGEADKAAALLVTLYEGDEIQNAARILIEQAMDIKELRAQLAQASTPGESQKGGDHEA